MLDILYSFFLGAIQGISEFLPISSSGHLILISYFFEGKTLPLTLNIALHLGTAAAVLIYFWKDWLEITRATYARITTGTKSFESDTLLPGILLGSIPAGVIGITFKDQIETIFHNPLSVVFPLAVVGILLWLVDIRSEQKRSIFDATIKDAIIIGCAQACALIPGVSRSGATILGARLLKFERESAAKYSFLLGTPAMAGAALLEARELVASIGDPHFYLGFISSFIVGCLTISFLLKFLRKFGFLIFAVYRLVIAITIFFILNP